MITSYLLNGVDSIFHFFSEKKDEFSFAPFTSIEFNNNKKVSFYPENIDKLAQYLQIDPINVVYPIQSHEDKIEVISENEIGTPSGTNKLINTDALITKSSNLFIGIKTADCTPILLTDPKEKIIAAVHSGWRSTALNIVGKTINRFKDMGSSTCDIIAVIGPSISSNNYPVGAEVVDALKKIAPQNNWCIQVDNKFHVDLKKVNHQLLISAGIDIKNVDIINHCTFQMKEYYYSARRDGFNTGRMLSGIMLKD